MTSVSCGLCGQRLWIENHTHSRIKCPKCGTVLEIANPRPGPIPPPPARIVPAVASAVDDQGRDRNGVARPNQTLPGEAQLIGVLGIIAGIGTLLLCPFFAMLLIAEACGNLGHPDVPLIHLVKEWRPYYYATAISTHVMAIFGVSWVCSGIGLLKQRAWAWRVAVYLLAIGIPLHITSLSYNFIVHYVNVTTCANGYPWLQHHRWYMAFLFGLHPVGCVLSIGMLLLLLRDRVQAFYCPAMEAGSVRAIVRTVFLGGGNALPLKILMILAWIVAVFFLIVALIAPSIQQSIHEHMERRFPDRIQISVLENGLRGRPRRTTELNAESREHDSRRLLFQRPAEDVARDHVHRQFTIRAAHGRLDGARRIVCEQSDAERQECRLRVA